MDTDGYPEKAELNIIKNWDWTDFPGLMDYVRERWKFADNGFWKQKGQFYWLSTAGWSGNERIIEALAKNPMFWGCCWEGSKRGGHYVFKLPKKEQIGKET